MHRLAVVPQDQLREPLRVAGRLCPFGPSLTVAMQADAGNSETSAALPEFICSISRLTAAQVGKQGPGRRQVLKDVRDRLSESNLWRREVLAPLRLHAHIGDRLARPIDVLGVEIGQVRSPWDAPRCQTSW